MARYPCFPAVLGALIGIGVAALAPAQDVALGGITFSNRGLVGVGRVDAAKRDKLNETFGSLSGLALDPRSWQRNSSGTYTGTLYTVPDRGYVKSGVTTNYRPRRHKFALSFKPDTNGSSKQDQVDLTLSESTLLTEASGTPLTSLDPTPTGSGVRSGFTVPLPQAYNGRLALDAEGLVLLPDGTFYVSDEYGPYLFRFAASGTLLGAVRPPEAFIPKRNAVDSFSSDSPAANQPSPSPSEPSAGRENNKGFEGLSTSADGRTLYTLMQSATRQDGGAGPTGQNRFVRLLAYDITTPSNPVLQREWILPLPLYTDANKVTQVAEQHELLALSNRHFLVLATDGNGRGGDATRSLFRAVVLYDVANATNIAGSSFDSPNTPVATNGVLASGITAATSATLIDLNDATQLSKFNLNNSANDNSDTLAAKWESMALAPALDTAAPDDFFLLLGNDNDFSTTDGTQLEGGSYKASTNVDTMVLVYRVSLPSTTTLPTVTTPPASRIATAGQTVIFTAAAMGNPSPTFQWTKNGTNISGATTTTLNLANVQAADAATYAVVVTNAVGSVTSSPATLTINGANSPVFSVPPSGQTIAPGTTVVFSATASNSPTYQWQRDGANLVGATSRLLVLANAGTADVGTYSVVASNASGLAVSSAAPLTVVGVAAKDVGRLINLSILTAVSAADPNFTVGTVLGGAGTSGAKSLLVRAAGPSLAPLGVSGALPNPRLDLFVGQTITANNDDWGGTPALNAAFSAVGAFAYTDAASRDSALIVSAPPPAGGYTVQVSGVGGTTGAVIAELYDATPASTFTTTTPRLVNVSVLKQISAGSLLTAGFVVGGTTAKTVLIRAIGPRLALAPFLIFDAMVDPKLDLFTGQTVIAANDNWGGDPQLTAAANGVGAFAVTDAASRDAMLLVTLPPGSYTAQASSVNNTGGRAIVEVYEVP